MTATIFVNKKLDWCPKSWIVEEIFQHIQTEAYVDEQALLADTLNHAVEVGIGDFTDLPSHDFQVLVDITRRAFNKYRKLKLVDLKLIDTDEEFFGVLLVFIQFYVLLCLDPRAKEKQCKGVLILDASHRWKNDIWICELIVLSISLYAKVQDWSDILSIKVQENLTIYDLSSMPTDIRNQFLKSVDYLTSYFDGTHYVTSAREFVEVLPPVIKAFHTFLSLYMKER